MSSIRCYVPAGASLLDRTHPHWEYKVSIPRLKMHDPFLCVLGQIFGHFVDGLRALEIPSASAQVWMHGFYIPPGAWIFPWSQLKHSWTREIEQRIAAKRNRTSIKILRLPDGRVRAVPYIDGIEVGAPAIIRPIQPQGAYFNL